MKKASNHSGMFPTGIFSTSHQKPRSRILSENPYQANQWLHKANQL